MPDTTRAPSSDPVGVDSTRPSIARVYDAALNGSNNFKVDREVLAQVRQVAPEISELAWANRNFLTRACRFLAGKAGISQYLDCGSGLPTAENTHQVVQRLLPKAKVLYVDNDPVVLAHGRALLEQNEHTLFVNADIFQPATVLDDPAVTGFLDFSQPIALIHNATMHHYLGTDGPDLIRRYQDALVPGSFLVLSHFFDPEDSEHSPIARAIERTMTEGPLGSGKFRTRSEIEAFFGGWEMVAPGLAVLDMWWPDGPQILPLSLVEECIAGGVARKA